MQTSREKHFNASLFSGLWMMSEWICLDYDVRTSQTIKAILIQEGVGGSSVVYLRVVNKNKEVNKQY